MQGNIQAFVQSLQLSSTQALALISDLEGVQNGSGAASSPIKLACQVAQAFLGSGSVETTPVSLTEADTNWSVIPGAPNCQMLTIVMKV